MPSFCLLPSSTPEHHTATDASTTAVERATISNSPSSCSSSSAFASGAAAISCDPSPPSIAQLHRCLVSFKPLLRSLPTAAPVLAVSETHQPLLYAASESEITVFDLAALRPVETIPGIPSAGAVKFVVVPRFIDVDAGSRSPVFFTAHQDGRIRVWRRSRRSGCLRLGDTLPTQSDRLLRLTIPTNYVTVRRHHHRLWIEHADVVSSLAVSRDGYLYSASWDKTLKVWRSSGDHRCMESFHAHDDAVNAVAVASDGTVYTGSANGSIRVWARPAAPSESWLRQPRRRHVLLATLEGHRSVAVNALSLSDDGSILYSGGGDGTILAWEREESARHAAAVGVLRGHAKAVLCLACARDVVVSGSIDRTVRIWRSGGDERFRCVGVLEGHATGVRSAAVYGTRATTATEEVAEDGDIYRVCSAGFDGEIRIWEVRVSDPIASN